MSVSLQAQRENFADDRTNAPDTKMGLPESLTNTCAAYWTLAANKAVSKLFRFMIGTSQALPVQWKTLIKRADTPRPTSKPT